MMPWFPDLTLWNWQETVISRPDPVGSVEDPDFPAERLAGFVPGRMVPSSTPGQRLYWNDQLVSLLLVFVVMFNFNYLIFCP